MDFDIVIVGGGLAGLALAAALRETPYRVALIEGRAPERPQGWDARIYAVSPANARFLDQLGIWTDLAPERIEPVRRMEIHGDAGGRLDFSAYDSGVGELAWIVESSLMQQALWQAAAKQDNLHLIFPARPRSLEWSGDGGLLALDDGRVIAATLVVAADGADSWTRTAAGIEVDFHRYGQHGVVANFSCALPHRGAAWQWFRDDGILAWLPLPGQRISIVWSTPEEHAEQLLALAPTDFCARVAEAGGERLGKLELLTPPAAFPLRLMRPPQSVLPHLALIGDAAHAIHPLSGHGINLGFQDARVLAEVLSACRQTERCGDLAVLRRYERARKEETVALQSVTDALQRLFAQPGLPFSVLRNLGLNLTNRLPVVRDMLVRYAMG